jgi:hypothetical protein
MPLHVSGNGVGVGRVGVGVTTLVDAGGVVVVVFAGTDVGRVEVGVIATLVSVGGVEVEIFAYADMWNR